MDARDRGAGLSALSPGRKIGGAGILGVGWLVGSLARWRSFAGLSSLRRRRSAVVALSSICLSVYLPDQRESYYAANTTGGERETR